MPQRPDPRARAAAEPVDPDVDLHVPARAEAPPTAVVAVVAAGGAVGACARYGASLLWPTAPGAFPLTTLLVNTAGCALIGVVMALVSHTWRVHPLVRPFAATGVLGGFTTFSTYAVDGRLLADGGRPGAALGYLGLTLAAALAAVWASATATRGLLAFASGRREAR